MLLDVEPDFGTGDPTMSPAPIPAPLITAEDPYDSWNADMVHSSEVLIGRNIPVYLNAASVFVGNQSNLLGYFSWGSNDDNFSQTAYNSLAFLPGAIGDTAVSTSARSFFPQTSGQSMVADLVAQGITGVKGYTDEPLLQAIASPTIAMDRFTQGFTLAESLYAASHFVGWTDTVLGDPLTRPYPNQAPPASDAGSPSPPSIARVQALAPGFVESETTTLTLLENAGDLLVAGIYFNQSAVTVTVTDSVGNAWTPISPYANTSSCAWGTGGNATVAQIFFARGVAAGTNVVTVTQSAGTSPLGAFLVEYSGAGALDGASGGPAASSTPAMSAGSLTTTSAHDLVVALFAEATTSGVMMAGPGYSAVADDSSFYSVFEDDLSSGAAPGAVAPTATEPGGIASDCWVAAAAAFMPAP